MPKAGMQNVGVEQMRLLIDGTKLKAKDIASRCGVSEAGYFKWLRNGIVPRDALETLILLNRFSEYDLAREIRYEDAGRKHVIDFEIRNYFGIGRHLFADVKISADQIENARAKVNSYKVPCVLIYLSNNGVIVENNKAMDSFKALEKSDRSKTSGSPVFMKLSEFSLDALISEIEKRGWAIKLERGETVKKSSASRASKKKTKSSM